jgi:hypothetical protein
MIGNENLAIAGDLRGHRKDLKLISNNLMPLPQMDGSRALIRRFEIHYPTVTLAKGAISPK